MKKQFLMMLFIGVSHLLVGQSIEQGITLFEAERYTEAKKVFQQLLKTEPNNVTAIEYLGDIFFRQEKWNEAASRFKFLVKRDENNAMYHYKYAGAIGLQAKNNKLKALFLIDDIKFHFKKAAILDTKFIDARLALVQLYLELPSALGGSIEVAKKYAKEIESLDEKAYQKAMIFINNKSSS